MNYIFLSEKNVSMIEANKSQSKGDDKMIEPRKNLHCVYCGEQTVPGCLNGVHASTCKKCNVFYLGTWEGNRIREIKLTKWTENYSAHVTRIGSGVWDEKTY